VILALDPGPKQSAYVLWDGKRIIEHDKVNNDTLLSFHRPCQRVIEMIASYGMPVGVEVFETVRWVGRFEQAWGGAELMFRRDVKLHLCRDSRAKDSNIRQALVDRFGIKGTKNAKGITYGLNKDTWQAFALAVTWWDRNKTAGPLFEQEQDFLDKRSAFLAETTAFLGKPTPF
jgi:hypothetical protein